MILVPVPLPSLMKGEMGNKEGRREGKSGVRKKEGDQEMECY